MRVCCTANASGVQNAQSTDKTASEAGVLRRDDGLPANLATTSLKEAWNNSYMRETRKAMMSGEQPASCLKCFKEEESGHRSKRQWETDKWIREIGIDDILQGYDHDTGEVPPRIRYVDLRLGSKCQLACIMCSPHDSSGWIKEHKEVWPQLKNSELKQTMEWEKDSGKLAWSGGSYNWHKNNPMFIEELYEQIPTLKQLYFAGGEPLIHDEHYILLEKIIADGFASQIELRYNSNGMEWKPELFDLWNHFKRVIFHFSVDAMEDRLEYIRYPAEWSHISRQIRSLDAYPYANLTLTTAYTVMALNIHHLPDFIKWKLESGFKLLNTFSQAGGMIDCHLAYWPPQLNVKALPEWYKNEVEQVYEEFYDWLDENWRLTGAPSFEEYDKHPYVKDRLRGLISFMKSEDWSVRLYETAEWCYTMAEKRSQNFDSVFPELDWLRWYTQR